MDTTSADSSDDPLHEFVDVEISVPDCKGPAREAELAATLQRFPGVRSFSLAAGKVAMTYEPVFVTKHELIEAIRTAGFHVDHVESSSSSPVSDALEKVVIEGERLGEKSVPQGDGSKSAEAT